MTHVLFNRECDLLFTCGKDSAPQVWYTDNGERLGTFEGHKGAINECDVSFDSKRLLTGSGDMTMKLWDVYTGKELYSFEHNSPVKSVGFATGDTMALSCQMKSGAQASRINVFNIMADMADQKEYESSLREFEQPEQGINFTRALWASTNNLIFSCDEGGYVRSWDVEQSTEVKALQAHKKSIRFMSFSQDKNLLLTASADMSARLIDVRSMEVVKIYQSDRPLNSCAISPILNHVMVAGGQDAIDVTLSAAKEGFFETEFWHIYYEEKLAVVKGHFGPVNTLAVSPNGKMFASGSEDGFVRLHHFDAQYLASQY